MRTVVGQTCDRDELVGKESMFRKRKKKYKGLKFLLSLEYNVRGDLKVSLPKVFLCNGKLHPQEISIMTL